jgi:dTDP-4-dehydrorhamnose 3,5-epimerase-like enzyme
MSPKSSPEHVYGRRESSVRGVSLFRTRTYSDARGALTVGEFAREVPFVPQRYFMIFDVPSQDLRGEHAHRLCHQYLVCVRGSLHAIVDDGENREEFVLDSFDLGLHMPPMTWGTQYNYSPGAILLVFASHHYDAEDYIRTYDQFIQETRSRSL